MFKPEMLQAGSHAKRIGKFFPILFFYAGRKLLSWKFFLERCKRKLNGSLNGSLANLASVTGKKVRTRTVHVCTCAGYPDRSHGFLRCAPGWAGNAGDREGQINAKADADTIGHKQGCFLTDGPACFQDGIGHAKETGLYAVVIRNNSAEKPL